jgi:hypothetical protein
MHTDGTGIEPLSGTSVISCIDLFNAYRNVSKPLCELPLLDISDSESAMRGTRVLTKTVFVDGIMRIDRSSFGKSYISLREEESMP